MKVTNLPKEILQTGDYSYLPNQTHLKAGPISAVYENGSIRYIKYRDLEVIRMINSAVRDHNWDTIPGEILSQEFSVEEEAFNIELKVNYKSSTVHFEAHYKISGTNTGIITFEMNGKALRSFKKNRIGFCVLHPVRECVGKPCEVYHSNGQTSKGKFPEKISPHQPFMDMKGIEWSLPDGSLFQLDLEGDTFEMEDQRNWTDASYKTYCTPLGIPFPVEVGKGDEISQVIRLTPKKLVEHRDSLGNQEVVDFHIFWDQKSTFPPIGSVVSSEIDTLSNGDVSKFQAIGFHHIRIGVKLFESGWEDHFRNKVNTHKALKLPFEVALHLPQENANEATLRMVSLISQLEISISSILLYQDGFKVITQEALLQIVPILRKHLPEVKIGGGTNAYFTELNREKVSPKLLDFITFSINPQVHAFDNNSLVETLEAQGYVVENAKYFSEGKDIYISPVTLKPRFNPNATGPEIITPDDQLPPQVDVRQMSMFCAGWTLGSIKYLAESGAKSISLFETVGRRGLMMTETDHLSSASFPISNSGIYPVYYVLKELLRNSPQHIVKSKSNCPLDLEGIVFNDGKNQVRLFLMNYSGEDITVNINDLQGYITVSSLTTFDEVNEGFTKTIENKYLNDTFQLEVCAYGIVMVDVV